MIVDFIQVKMTKGRHTLTMNLIAHIMTYETKEKCLHDNKKGVIHFFKKKQQTKQQKTYENSKNPLA